jgi:hypothetical protein
MKHSSIFLLYQKRMSAEKNWLFFLPIYPSSHTFHSTVMGFLHRKKIERREEEGKKNTVFHDSLLCVYSFFPPPRLFRLTLSFSVVFY